MIVLAKSKEPDDKFLETTATHLVSRVSLGFLSKGVQLVWKQTNTF